MLSEATAIQRNVFKYKLNLCGSLRTCMADLLMYFCIPSGMCVPVRFGGVHGTFISTLLERITTEWPVAVQRGQAYGNPAHCKLSHSPLLCSTLLPGPEPSGARPARLRVIPITKSRMLLKNVHFF